MNNSPPKYIIVETGQEGPPQLYHNDYAQYIDSFIDSYYFLEKTIANYLLYRHQRIIF